ncbi:MAG: DNA polymerase III subunit gamma/tau [Candidatus Dojkabacteria bacterium]|jgi:DNA polymerase-3 subunit gamma/tau|nr:DNA polymerase III subunit gamma/tau [Candidatus Dojkabacteria bacterium]MDD4560855.1 DNA polymerase III subunit gamma/tau [Candidatus Dojkabacteria bacterium]
MSSVLYQKYRSSDFNELQGQDHVTKLLKNAVKTKQIAQAYLFVGSRGTGKTSTARILAKAVNCKKIKSDGNPCNECESCISISTGRFLDLIEVDAASNRGIDQIRELKEKIEFSPSEGKYKVYIIDEVHMLTTEAFNALLKTLEEPPAHVIFILATTDVHKLPPTILSRCQRYDFRLGTNEEIATLITDICKKEKIKIEEGALNIVVQNAKGSYRDALSILDVIYTGQDEKINEITTEEARKILGLPERDSVILLLKSLVKGDGGKSLDIIGSLEKNGVNLQQFTNYTLDILRQILIAKIKGKVEKEIDFVKEVDIKTIYKLINLFLNAENRIRYANNQALVLEMIIPEMMKVDGEREIEIVNRDVKKRITEPKQEEEKEEVMEEKDIKEVSLNEISKRWDEFINEIKPFNGHLYAFLGGANVKDFNKGILHLEVPFKFHEERIEVPKSRNAISETFKKVYGTNCKVSCVVNPSMKSKKSEADFVLRKLPIIKPKEKEKNVAVNVEAIFEGM